MRRAIALLCFSLLLLLATSLSSPLSVDVVRNHVKLLAQTTMVRIQKLSDEVILVHLQMAGTSQIHADITSLQGVVRSLAVLSDCPPRKAGATGHLETFLKSSAAFHVTVGSVTLTRLQTFLGQLIVNLDLLKTC